MNIKTIIIDANRTLGSTMLLTSVKPYYDYVNGVKSADVAGFKYEVCRKSDLEKFNVKIAGKQLIDAPKNGFVEVKFIDLVMSLYQADGQIKVTATASSVTLLNSK